MHAARRGNFSVVAKLFSFDVKLDVEILEDRQTVLHLAAGNGHVFVEVGANFDKKDVTGKVLIEYLGCIKEHCQFYMRAVNHMLVGARFRTAI